MEQIYLDTARILKAISDPKRLKIVDMLSCKEQCANKLQQAFAITQPWKNSAPSWEKSARRKCTAYVNTEDTKNRA